MRQLEKTQSERDQNILDRDQVTLNREKNILEWDILKAELEQTRKVQENKASRDQEVGNDTERKARTPVETTMARIRPESKMEVDEVSRTSNCFDRVTQEQMSEDLETWTPTPGTHSALEIFRVEPYQTADCGCETTWPDAQKELQKRLQSRNPESPASEG